MHIASALGHRGQASTPAQVYAGSQLSPQGQHTPSCDQQTTQTTTLVPASSGEQVACPSKGSKL